MLLHFKYIFILVLLITTYGAEAQRAIPTSYNYNSALKYANYPQGTIKFKDGSVFLGLLNYDLQNQLIIALDAENKPFAIELPETIKFAVIEDDTFYYQKGFMQILVNNTQFTLARKSFYKMIVSDSRAGRDKTIINVHMSHVQNKAGKFIYYQLIHSYFLGDKYNRFIPVNKKNLLLLFEGKEKKLRQFLDFYNFDLKMNQI